MILFSNRLTFDDGVLLLGGEATARLMAAALLRPCYSMSSALP